MAACSCENGNASTLAVVNGVRKALQIARAAAPPGLTINELFDQAKLVSEFVASVAREGAIAAGLTALMILLFLGSWRNARRPVKCCCGEVHSFFSAQLVGVLDRNG